VRVELADRSLAGVRTLGTRVGQVLERQGFPADRPLVILVPDNVGKVLGQYVTRWGTRPITLVVIDEIVVRDGQYVHIGTPRDQAIPVSFYGLQA
jgi:ethanolamine utilization protein EutA